ncbi:MAG TPA: hypothetical protein VMG40_20105 [Bryobacteraceae bacterium]|nr:hypothetical protein [Bryobacteraceae bacterium]
MVSLDRFELLELRRHGGIQTYHAREIATARPVQVHFFTEGNTPDTDTLLGMLHRLPEAERRRVLDRGESQGLPYIVTDRLAGYADFREWLTSNVASAPAPARRLSVDEQFFALFDSPAPQMPAPAAPPQSMTSPAMSGPAMKGPAAFSAAAAVETPAYHPNAHPDAPQQFPAEVPEQLSMLNASIEVEGRDPRRRFLPTAAKSLLWLMLGILAALAFLAAVLAFFAFRPR